MELRPFRSPSRADSDGHTPRAADPWGMSTVTDDLTSELGPPLAAEAAVAEADRCGLERAARSVRRGTDMTKTPLRLFAVTCVVPKGAGEQLRVQVAGRTVTVAAPDGFARTFDLPSGAASKGIQWQVYGDVFELRAPYRRALTKR